MNNNLENTDDDLSLSFELIVEQAFYWLQAFGFARTTHAPFRLRYENTAVFIVVSYDQTTHSVEVRIGRQNEGNGYNLYEILTAMAQDSVALSRFRTKDRVVCDRNQMAVVRNESFSPEWR